jgi:hypothetical protein
MRAAQRWLERPALATTARPRPPDEVRRSSSVAPTRCIAGSRTNGQQSRITQGKPRAWRFSAVGIRPERSASNASAGLSAQATRSCRSSSTNARWRGPDWLFVDSPLEGTGFEPSVPLLRKALLGIANRMRRHDSQRHPQVETRDSDVCMEWLLIAFPFPEGPRVRIRFPPAVSLQTFGPWAPPRMRDVGPESSSENHRPYRGDRGFESRYLHQRVSQNPRASLAGGREALTPGEPISAAYGIWANLAPRMPPSPKDTLSRPSR